MSITYIKHGVAAEKAKDEIPALEKKIIAAKSRLGDKQSELKS